jgi:phosphatidylethanolamine/phosphatidyl-N-methylethanolamine N-methyltransferase
MLKRARGKVRRKGLTHVKGLQVMVLDPRHRPVRLAEMVGEHDAAAGAHHAQELGERGFRVRHQGDESSDFKATRIEAWAQRNGVEVVGLAPTFPGGFFKILRMRKRG